MSDALTSARRRKLKAIAQRLDASIKIGKNGLTDGFLKELDDALKRNELVKVRFVEFKEEKKELAPKIAEQTQSHLVTMVGHVAVYYREKPDSAKRNTKE
ncbi:YhbY family RNA-binding protein [Verrucomicrobia bacterium]|jgi:RNA-binding protein|nr:YhbY family RNA-binding protein [Verrucomicrobiota bacterium]MDB4691147.1 YhbY family RNA-binding protein [Verrucomicrobiota bacterium]